MLSISDRLPPSSSSTIRSAALVSDLRGKHLLIVPHAVCFIYFSHVRNSIWKETGKNVTSWKPIVQVAAIDCSTDENNDICREFEVMRYPTMRYFPPGYATGKTQIGENLDHLLLPQLDDLIDELTKHLQNETNGGPEWPNFQKFEARMWSEVFQDSPLDTKYVYVISDRIPGLLPAQVILDHVGASNIYIRIVDAAKMVS